MDNKALKSSLKDVYRRLYHTYGQQHWWPAEGPFEVIIGAILTQSAAWPNVEKAILNLKKAGALTPGALRRISLNKLARLVYPSGYYNVKARKLKAFVEWLGEKHDDSLDSLFKPGIPELRESLLGIYGIGEETADSIILYAGNKPIFVIDAYTRRIFDRLGSLPPERTYNSYQKMFMDFLPADAALFNEYHALLVKLGKEACRKNPLCSTCCLKTRCAEFKKNR